MQSIWCARGERGVAQVAVRAVGGHPLLSRKTLVLVALRTTNTLSKANTPDVNRPRATPMALVVLVGSASPQYQNSPVFSFTVSTGSLVHSHAGYAAGCGMSPPSVNVAPPSADHAKPWPSP
jgi:hypothetical protein